MIVRASPVGNMIIDSVAAFTGTLFGSGEMADIAVVIITPHQGHVFGYLQPRMINIEHFLIRNKDLRHLCYVFIHVLFEQAALVNKYPVQDGFLFFYRLGSLHLSIVNATHTQRVKYLLSGNFFHTIFPKLINGRTVIHVIVCSFSTYFPFSGSIARHWFAVGSSHKDAILFRCFPIALRQKERQGTLMHSRPVGIGPQTKQQLKNTFVGTRPDFSFHIRRFVSLVTPRHQSPIFIINKDAPILHRRRLQLSKLARKAECLFLLRSHIRPPFPRGNAQQTGYFKYAVGCTVTVAAGYYQLSIF